MIHFLALLSFFHLHADTTAYTITEKTAKHTRIERSNYPEIRKSGMTIESFLPDRWKIIAEASGDLNKDGVSDEAVVIESLDTLPYEWTIYHAGDTMWGYNKITIRTSEDTVMTHQAAARILLILIKQPDSSWQCAVQSNHAILHSDEGGMQGDPFDEEYLKIRRGSIYITLQGGGGGSPYQTTHQYRYQKDDWYLIGFSGSWFNSGTWTSESTEFNLLTGKGRIEKTNENKRSTKSKNIKIGKKPLRKLRDFRPYEWEVYKDEWI
jgi:hypothetical protein